MYGGRTVTTLATGDWNALSKVSNISQLGFYATPPHECSYLDNRTAATLFADPHFPKDKRLYSTLSAYGFRRSGEHLYRPRCPGCNACVPVRIPVNSFKMKRAQRRTWKRNADLTVNIIEGMYLDRHFDLYKRYLNTRHKDGGMDSPTPQSYLDFLTSSWSQTMFYEFALNDQVLAVAVVDHLEDALSSVYTFFDPAHQARGLGVYSILWQVQEAKRLGHKWVYLGYWIRQCEKMHYKINYQPQEHYRNGQWLTMAPDDQSSVCTSQPSSATFNTRSGYQK